MGVNMLLVQRLAGCVALVLWSSQALAVTIITGAGYWDSQAATTPISVPGRPFWFSISIETPLNKFNDIFFANTEEVIFVSDGVVLDTISGEVDFLPPGHTTFLDGLPPEGIIVSVFGSQGFSSLLISWLPIVESGGVAVTPGVFDVSMQAIETFAGHGRPFDVFGNATGSVSILVVSAPTVVIANVPLPPTLMALIGGLCLLGASRVRIVAQGTQPVLQV